MTEEETMGWLKNRLQKIIALNVARDVPLTVPEVYDLLYGGTDVDEEFKALLEEEEE